MSAPIDIRLSPRAKIAGALGIGFGFFAGAGVTGLSLCIGIIGLWAWIYGLSAAGRPLLSALKVGVKTNWLVWMLFLAFAIWVMVSATWSPAHKLAGESVRRISAMMILAPAAVWAASSTEPADQKIFHFGLLSGLGIAFFILLLEVVTTGHMNAIASPEKDPLAIAGDLGRAATASLALFWAGFTCLKRYFDKGIVLTAFVILGGILALQFGTDLNAVGLIVGSVGALLALRFPKLTIGALSGGCAMIMMTAPFLYPMITKIAVSLIPGGQLPLSYARRAQMWQVASDLITEKPVQGWGVGAGSTFDRIISFGGFDWPLIQLHPHAAPLHIWLETGAVGATLAALTIVPAGAAAIQSFGRHKIASAALVGGMTFLAINWAFSHAAWREWMWTSFAMVLVAAMTLRAQERKKPQVGPGST